MAAATTPVNAAVSMLGTSRWAGLILTAALITGISTPVLAAASDPVTEEVASDQTIRMQRPTVFSVDLGFPKGLGLSAMHNIRPEWAIGATASHVLLWPTVGVFGRYFFEANNTVNSPFAEWRVYGHPGVQNGAYLMGPHWSTHLVYGWENRSADGYYSHMALGLGIGDSTTEGMLLGFLTFEVSFGGSISTENSPESRS